MSKYFLNVLFAVLVLSSCNSNSAETENEETVDNSVVETIEEDPMVTILESDQIATAHLLLTPELFKLKLDAVDIESIALLDIRTPEELAENGTIEGAINVDYYNESFEETIKAMDRDVPVMVYCRSGGRSGEAASLLKEWGFSQVYDLNGGYNAWLEKGY